MSLADFIHEKPVIATARLVLRPLTKADVPDLEEWMPDPSLYAYWGKGPGKAEKNPELLFQKKDRPSKSFHLGIALKQSGKVVGDLWVYLIENDRMAAVAIRLSNAYQGNGYGTEALSEMVRFCFERTELKRLWAQVDIHNTASQRMLEKCGFIREGLIRQGKMVNTWCDHFIYGILATDLCPKARCNSLFPW